MNSSQARKHAEQYLAIRRSMGFKMRSAGWLLLGFVKWLEARGFTGALTSQLALEWACAVSNRCGPGTSAQRLSAIRGFLGYLQASEPQTEVPEPGLLRRSPRPVPHIYSSAEIQALLDATRLLRPRDSLRPHTYATLFGLLLSCGLRIGEAIKLRIADVDLEADPARLHIEDAKFGKSRIVPLHPTSASALREYANQRERRGYGDHCDVFFVSESHHPLNYITVAGMFIRLTRCAGIRKSAGEAGPTLHSMRHTFVVQRLLLWCQQGADVRRRLPELSVFVGHSRPEHTYWYLTATPELLCAAADHFKAYADGGGES